MSLVFCNHCVEVHETGKCNLPALVPVNETVYDLEEDIEIVEKRCDICGDEATCFSPEWQRCQSCCLRTEEHDNSRVS